MPRFDVAALRQWAGKTLFERGEAYHREGRVEIRAQEGDLILLRVVGTRHYTVELSGRGARFGGECNCPAYEDHLVCKHMVAAMLAVNEAGGVPSAEAATTTRIRDYLRTRPVDELVELIIGQAWHDDALFSRLATQATVLQGEDDAIRQHFDRALRAVVYADYEDYDDGYDRGYDEHEEFPDLGAVCDIIEDLAAAGRHALVLDLALRVVDDVEEQLQALEHHSGSVDDLDRPVALHAAAAAACRVDPIDLARDLFRRETQGLLDVFDGAVVTYAEALGETGVAEYRRLAETASAEDDDIDSHRLWTIRDRFAERDGDLDTRIALRAERLSSQLTYLRLAEFCRKHGRNAEALRYARMGLDVDDQGNDLLVMFAAELMVEAGQRAEAIRMLADEFAREPGKRVYKMLSDLADDSIIRQAIAALRTFVAAHNKPGMQNYAAFLVEVLTERGEFADAWAVCRHHRVPEALLASLAMASEASMPQEAIAFYVAEIDRQVEVVGSAGYEKAAQFVARLAGLRDAATQSGHVAELKQRFRRKRNFMKLLR